MRRLTSDRRIGVEVAALGLIMMGYGIWRGEVTTVLTKAVRICLECIGIG